ncbi:hypothetical protein HanXRQr2_Chr15g0713161 [Helianthus annuus]|uniref:Uncharacterized protein n=1 Tax=Helianthus annuus TaxID=4232 RepID=A0A251SF05_HELAN|nr:hypothetical protein HanXRQr2_Chr15g0713161 [Helianthus annuus]KAJ0832933.1 hypothetical protein HanPSC8_Chr15g0684411 [Helianthus annuus]
MLDNSKIWFINKTKGSITFISQTHLQTLLFFLPSYPTAVATTSPYYHHHQPLFKPFSYTQRCKESYKQAWCTRKFKDRSCFLLSTTFTPCFFPSLVLVVVTQQVELGSTISRDALLKLRDLARYAMSSSCVGEMMSSEFRDCDFFLDES